MTGGAPVDVSSNFDAEVASGLAPTVALFVNYMILNGLTTDLSFLLRYVSDVVEFAGSDRIVDETLLETLRNELEDMERAGVITFPRGRRTKNVSYSTPATLLFNAFTYGLNAENSYEFGYITEDDEPVEDPSVDAYAYFKLIESMFLSNVKTYSRVLRTGSKLIGNAPPPPPGDAMPVEPAGDAPMSNAGVSNAAADVPATEEDMQMDALSRMEQVDGGGKRTTRRPLYG
jgi:hypothetical protein